jgi:hypothetical protein
MAMDRSPLFRELSLDQMVDIGAQCQAGELPLSDRERYELARLIVRRKEVVAELEQLVNLFYPPPPSPPPII